VTISAEVATDEGASAAAAGELFEFLDAGGEVPGAAGGEFAEAGAVGWVGGNEPPGAA